MGIPDHLTCLLRNLYTSKEATVRTGRGTTNWFQIGKGVHQGCILSPCLFNLYADYIMQNARWMKHKLESRLPGEINYLRYTDDTTFMAESEEEIKSLKWKWKSCLKLNIQEKKKEYHGIWAHHFLANRWGNNGNSERLYFLGLQNHCRWWLQPWNENLLAFWKESYDQPRQHIKKQRHYFANKGPSSQGYGFPSSHVWTWELDYKESQAPKNWCFWTVVLEKTLESPSDCKATMLKEISPEYSLEGLMLKLKLQ